MMLFRVIQLVYCVVGRVLICDVVPCHSVILLCFRKSADL